MTCPVCHQDVARRSRRRSIADYLFSVAGVYPWRCQNCNARFHSRMMRLSDLLYAHCPMCGNLSLKRISAEHVDTLTGPLWRLLRIPALRCEPCRHKYFSILPMYRSRNGEAEVSSGD